MLDIRLIREQPDSVRENLARRKDPHILAVYDELLEVDAEWRRLKQENDRLRAERNRLSEAINKAVKTGEKEKLTALRGEAKQVAERLKAHEPVLKDLEERRRMLLLQLPNLLADEVPYGESDADNVELERWGNPREAFPGMPAHGEWLEQHGLADFTAARKVAGAGFWYLRGKAAQLQMALIRLAMDHFLPHGFEFIIPPHMLWREAYEGVTSLQDFEDVMYKIEGEEHYLIATAEHPLIARWKDHVFKPEDLPLKHLGLSLAFRKEIGSHGVDTRGLHRVHEFWKVEQTYITLPEDSWKTFDEMLRVSRAFWEKLGIPYRLVEICTGDIGVCAARKMDIELWSPREKAYREIGSYSNCTTYQSIRLNMRVERDGKREYVHTLNGTAIPIQRALRFIIENFMQEDGMVKLPRILAEYAGFDTLP